MPLSKLAQQLGWGRRLSPLPRKMIQVSFQQKTVQTKRFLEQDFKVDFSDDEALTRMQHPEEDNVTSAPDRANKYGNIE